MSTDQARSGSGGSGRARSGAAGSGWAGVDQAGSGAAGSGWAGVGPVARVAGLGARTGDGRELLRDVGFALHTGRVTALTGPSGSGKTTTALALTGAAGPGVRLSGLVEVAGHRVVGEDGPLPAAERVRGRVVAYLPQHAELAANPARRAGSVLTEIARVHHPGAGRAGRARLVEAALHDAALPAEPGLLRRFPHQFSGGQRRRLVLAQALLCDPAVLVLDEPTTGLDPDAAARLVDSLAGLAGRGAAILLLSHDADTVRALADEVLVLRHGRLVEPGEVRPTPSPAPERPGRAAPVVVAAESLTATHRAGRGWRTVLDRVDLRIAAGECVGLSGPSGSGKTTLGRCLAGLHPVDSGRVLVHGTPIGPLSSRDPAERRRVQYVWQDVAASFDPRRPVLHQVARTAQRLRGLDRAASRAEARRCLAELGVSADVAARLPASLSGGELRRAALARALLAEPDLLICDEITSSLDPDRAADVLAVLDAIRRTRHTAVLLISHDHATLTRAADRTLTLTLTHGTLHLP
jgi:peptide/nickel transport system ATP-binding protein